MADGPAVGASPRQPAAAGGVVDHLRRSVAAVRAGVAWVFANLDYVRHSIDALGSTVSTQVGASRRLARLTARLRLPSFLGGLAGIVIGLLASLLSVVGYSPRTWAQLLGEGWAAAGDDPACGSRLLETAHMVWQVLLPSWWGAPPDDASDLVRLMYRDTAAVYKPNAAQMACEPNVLDERWLLINGVATPRRIAQANARRLCSMMGRPVTLVHNPTDGVGVDLVECALGKVKLGPDKWETVPRQLLDDTLEAALRAAPASGVKRVVLIAHSQGTIIAANAIDDLVAKVDAGDAELGTLMRELLEVYCFATCCHRFNAAHLRHVEHICNEHDFVARLGALSPTPWWRDYRDGRKMHIEGAKHTADLSGHLLNTHYLAPLEGGAYPHSRLHEYMRT